MRWKSLLCLLSFAIASPASDLLVQNVTVVDVRTGAELPRRSVLIHNKQIAAVAPVLRAPRNTQVVNGAGKFLIPGLWDMHVHLWYRENQFAQFLANGVTGVRDMGSDLNWVNQWREQIKAGKLLGPHIETSGPSVDGRASSDEKLPVFVVRRPNDARSTFDHLDELDVDFISVLAGIPRDAYFALIERARKYYVPVAGPVPKAVSLMEAIDARQKSIERMSGLLLACSKREEKLRAREMLALEKQDLNAYADVQAEVLDTFDPAKAKYVIERMARFEVRQVPALVMLRRTSLTEANALAASPHLRATPEAIRKTWPDPREEMKKMPARNLELAQAAYEKLHELLPQMHRAGVIMMAGTGAGAPYTFPGSDLHKELELLVAAGLTPLEALRSATLEPAQIFRCRRFFRVCGTGPRRRSRTARRRPAQRHLQHQQNRGRHRGRGVSPQSASKRHAASEEALSRSFLRSAVDRCRPRHMLHRMLLQQFQRFRHGTLQLRIVALHHLGRRVLHLDIGRDPLVLYRPLPSQIVERQARSRDPSAIDRLRSPRSAHQSSPRSRAHQRADLAQMEIVGQRVARRSPPIR